MDWRRAVAEKLAEILKDAGNVPLAAGAIGPSLTRLAGGQPVAEPAVVLALGGGALIAYVLAIVCHVLAKRKP